jgi:hypothetical protein
MLWFPKWVHKRKRRHCIIEPSLFSIDIISLSIVQQFEPLMSIKPKSTFTFLVSNVIFLDSIVPHKSVDYPKTFYELEIGWI